MRKLLFAALFFVIGLKFKHTSAFEPPIEDLNSGHGGGPWSCIDGMPCQNDRQCKGWPTWPRDPAVCAPTDYSDGNR